jgi:hypothetical protein
MKPIARAVPVLVSVFAIASFATPAMAQKETKPPRAYPELPSDIVQDVRGKHGSEGDYVVNRPLRGPLNNTPVDHATDTFDTIDWLVGGTPPY